MAQASLLTMSNSMTSRSDVALRTISLCSGVGGLDLGLDLACARLGLGGADAVAYVEGEAFAAATLVGAMEKKALAPAPIWSDLRTFDPRPWRGKVDCVTAGYPCQPFSLAGKGLGSDDPRHLWPDVARIVRGCRPPLCFFENVGGHLVRGLHSVATELQAMGYSVAATLWTAAEVGAPHKRERLFILAADPERVHLREQSRRLFGSRRKAPTLAPVDGAEWTVSSAVLVGRPWSAEPSVGRVAHGVAARVDRLRACGNGVVPEQAARAFVEMWKELT